VSRQQYTIFSKGNISNLTIANRLVRSATWDPSILKARKMSDEVLQLYQELALGGVGLIISGGLWVCKENPKANKPWISKYHELRVTGIEEMAQVVHSSQPECRIIVQLENGQINAGPSEIIGSKRKVRELSKQEITDIIDCFVDAIIDIQQAGFDGVQLHAAHGGLLSTFLSPYTNKRDDEYGGSITGRVAIIRKIISKARELVGDFPILIKMNCTDYLVGGIDFESFPVIAKEIENAGVDAIEVSGGMWQCLKRSETELGFRPVPAPESHTRLKNSEKQSYFLKYVEDLDLTIPVILVGGNRDVERLEEIVKSGKVDFIALSRPLIRESGLPNRWLAGNGSKTECISCNSCIYSMYKYSERLVTCIHKYDKVLHKKAQQWLSSWENRSKDS
jgi:2,4-dienoyl-CoA reductase-like NADH-dependent reductase (Old Yellow Enzyme family)